MTPAPNELRPTDSDILDVLLWAIEAGGLAKMQLVDMLDRYADGSSWRPQREKTRNLVALAERSIYLRREHGYPTPEVR